MLTPVTEVESAARGWIWPDAETAATVPVSHWLITGQHSDPPPLPDRRAGGAA